MRDSLRPDRTTARTGHRIRSLLCGAAAAALVGGAVVAPAPATAAARCGPKGGPAPTEAPWALTRLDPSPVWRVTRGEHVRVAVIDSGVSPSHPLLRGKVLPGADYNHLPALKGQCDLVGHGTLIAGIIAGKEGTGAAYSGIAPEAEILPVRVLADNERTFDESLPAQIGDAIRYAVTQGRADVINLSLVTLDDRRLREAVDFALDKGVIVVAAAGNRQENQQDQPAYPAAYPGVIAVAGMDENGEHVGTSVTGDYVDIAGPGLNIVGPAPQGGYLALPNGGTSFATAYVSGVAALIRAAHPELTPRQVEYRLTRTADNPPDGHNAEVGYGMVNPYRAVTSLLGTRTDPSLGAMPPPVPPADPLARQRDVAIWVAAVGGLLAAVLLTLRPILALGRRRGWRPGRRATPVDA